MRAESKVQCRFNTAYLSMSQLGSSFPVAWFSALPRRVDLPKATSSCLFDMSKRPADEPAAVRSSQRPRVAPGWRREGGAEELVAGPSHLVPSLRSRARALLTDARARELSRDDHVMHHMILAICASIYRAPDALASDKRPRPALGGAIGSHGCRSASSVLPFVPPSPHRRVAPLSRLSFCSGPAVAFARGALLGRLRMLSLWLRLVCPPPRHPHDSCRGGGPTRRNPRSMRGRPSNAPRRHGRTDGAERQP